ncbi:hypothetical protein ADUPG1_009437 [Aduncisulcus paluster]|uniref:Phospholipid/glycerol acyltransferase domain-containing protein n=1 Tax=Aduncisulcus paluster TaxID=2918883 RepID=A0ABQ5KZJ7_9EUKA|nr:hypothetical protein ADUPG1_009437 [Aduncisulcus paluster]
MFASGKGKIPERVNCERQFRQLEKLIFGPFVHIPCENKYMLPYHYLKMFIAYVTVRIMFSGAQLTSHGTLHPGSKRDRITRGMLKGMARCILFVSGHHYIHTTGFENVNTSSCKIAVIAPHTSWSDILLLLSFGFSSFVAKSELKKVPLVGYIARGAGALFVERSCVDSRTFVRESITKRATTPDGVPMCLFVDVKRNGKVYFNVNTSSCKIAVIAPHTSWSDILLLLSFGFSSFVAKSELKKVPLVGYIARGAGALFVERSCVDSRTFVRESITKRATTPDGVPMCLFVEGTTTNASMLLQYRAGVFRAGVSVQPIIVKYPYVFDNPAWDTNGSIPNIIHVLSQLHNRAEIHFLPVHDPTDAELKDPISFAEHVRVEMSSYSSIPHSYLTQKHKLIYQDYVYGLLTWDEMMEKIEEKCGQSVRDLLRLGCKDLGMTEAQIIKKQEEFDIVISGQGEGIFMNKKERKKMQKKEKRQQKKRKKSKSDQSSHKDHSENPSSDEKQALLSDESKWKSLDADALQALSLELDAEPK